LEASGACQLDSQKMGQLIIFVGCLNDMGFSRIGCLAVSVFVALFWVRLCGAHLIGPIMPHDQGVGKREMEDMP